MEQQNNSFTSNNAYNASHASMPYGSGDYTYPPYNAAQNAAQQQPGDRYQQSSPQQPQAQYVQSQYVPVQQYAQPGEPQLISTGCKVMYALLGFFVPFIGLICLVCSDKACVEGALREKAKWLAIGAAVLVIVNFLYFMVTGFSALSGFDAGSTLANSSYSL